MQQRRVKKRFHCLQLRCQKQPRICWIYLFWITQTLFIAEHQLQIFYRRNNWEAPSCFDMKRVETWERMLVLLRNRSLVNETSWDLIFELCECCSLSPVPLHFYTLGLIKILQRPSECTKETKHLSLYLTLGGKYSLTYLNASINVCLCWFSECSKASKANRR